MSNPQQKIMKKLARTRKRTVLAQRMRSRGYASTHEAARMAGVHPVTVATWIKHNKIKSVKAAGRRFVLLESLAQYVGPAFQQEVA